MTQDPALAAAVPLAARSRRLGGCELDWVEAGEGPETFLLVHGLGGSATKWRPLVGRLAPRGRAVALDLPGYGRSAAPRARYSLGWLAGAIRAFMDAEGIERAHVVGNSLGGSVALWLGAAWPERVATMSLLAPALPSAPGQRHSRRTWSRFVLPLVPGVGEALLAAGSRLRTAEWIVDESLAANCADPARVPPEVRALLIEETLDRAGRADFRRALLSTQRHLAWALTAGRERVGRVAGALRVPALLVWGSEDRIVPLAVGEHWVARIPGAELLVLEGLGHNPQLEDPDRVAGALVAFSGRA